MSATSKFNALSWLEKRTVLSALFMLPLSAIALSGLGLKRTHGWFLSKPKKVSKLGPREQTTLAKAMARAVDIAAAHGFYHANCLKRSLVLGRLLRSQGIESNLKIGTCIKDGEFFAHAWLMCGDVVVNDRPNIVEDFCAFEGKVSDKQFV